MATDSLCLGLSAGEPSGDILGGALLQTLTARYGCVRVTGIGGERMEAFGLSSLCPIDRLSVMGLVEPLLRLPEILRIRRQLITQQLNEQPQMFLGIDSPDFNLPVERRLRRAGIRTAHLVSPSVWAWRQGRIRSIRKAVDKMLCLLPFEVDIYAKAGIDAVCVGHPLVDEMRNMLDGILIKRQIGIPADGNVLAVLPGSRQAEVLHLMPLFVETMKTLQKQHLSLHFVIPAANESRRKEIESALDEGLTNVHVLNGKSREAIQVSNAVLLASGTASLEAMLLQKPMVIAYRMAAISWMILSKVVRTRYVGLPNILAGRSVVPELLQEEATSSNLVAAVNNVLESGSEEQVPEFERLSGEIGGQFSQRCVEALVPIIESQVRSGIY